jgi:hypothetical protein
MTTVRHRVRPVNTSVMAHQTTSYEDTVGEVTRRATSTPWLTQRPVVSGVDDGAFNVVCWAADDTGGETVSSASLSARRRRWVDAVADTLMARAMPTTLTVYHVLQQSLSQTTQEGILRIQNALSMTTAEAMRHLPILQTKFKLIVAIRGKHSKFYLHAADPVEVRAQLVRAAAAWMENVGTVRPAIPDASAARCASASCRMFVSDFEMNTVACQGQFCPSCGSHLVLLSEIPEMMAYNALETRYRVAIGPLYSLIESFPCD